MNILSHHKSCAVLAPILGMLLAVPTVLADKSDQAKQFWMIERDGQSLGLFTACSMLGSKNEVLSTEVESTYSPIKTPGRGEYLNVECRRPISTNLALWSWREAVMSGVAEYKSQVSITVYNQQATPLVVWQLEGAWPSAIATGPESGGNTLSLVELVVLTCDGMDRVK